MSRQSRSRHPERNDSDDERPDIASEDEGLFCEAAEGLLAGHNRDDCNEQHR